MKRLNEEDLREIEGILEQNDSTSKESAYNALPLLISEVKRLQGRRNSYQKFWLSKLINASYRLGMQLKTKDESELTDQERIFLDQLDMCAHYNVSGDEILYEGVNA